MESVKIINFKRNSRNRWEEPRTTLEGRICSKCNIRFPIEFYSIDRSRFDGLCNYCKKCAIIRVKKYPKNTNSEKFRKSKRKSRLKSLYGITPEAYDVILQIQNNCCAICRCKFPQDSKRLPAVDHCHKTNFIRGILCSPCNTGIGLFKENKTFLLSAIDYISRNTGE